jgi:ribonucleotide reductase beta subunit family protein with ferritin-like domain
VRNVSRIIWMNMLKSTPKKGRNFNYDNWNNIHYNVLADDIRKLSMGTWVADSIPMDSESGLKNKR